LSILVDPTALLQKIAPKSRLKKLLNQRKMTVKKTALKLSDELPIDKAKVVDVALKVAKTYQARLDLLDPTDAKAEKLAIAKDPKLLVQRVQNALVFEITERVKDNYAGERYRWLPSDAEEQDPEHALNYGKIFVVGDGEMPGERYGCRCGMEILTDETELDLE
jgi:hypothetical protein